MNTASGLLEYFRSLEAGCLTTLRRLVEYESCSSDKNGIDALVAHLADLFASLGARPRIIPEPTAGNHLETLVRGAARGKSILVLGHVDTVWPRGTLASRPFRAEGGRAYGPGVYDMKAGLLLCVLACQACRDGAFQPRREVRFLFTSDEETGTATGLPHLRAAAEGCEAVLCLEPPLPGGGVKTSRKGVSTYRLCVRGIEAHAGVDPQSGASAIAEISRLILRIGEMADMRRGLTVNVGTVRGGIASNVVAPEAEAEVDVRFRSARDGLEIDRRLRELEPTHPRCSLDLQGGVNRPPLDRSAGVLSLYGAAVEAARQLEMELAEGESGGGSDGSFTAAMGIPTLDGLGVLGEGAHARHENVVLEDIPRRAALLCVLLASL